MLIPVTHLAGPVVRIGPRLIQRCAVCGEKLCDNRRVATCLNPDGTEQAYPTWREGAIVRYQGYMQTELRDFDDPNQLPGDFCLALVEN